MKISELTINQRVTIPLVVKTATARKTVKKKDYLNMTFTDGVDSIQGNFWDWSGVNIPDVNAILDVTAQVSVWQGAKQLNISKLATNTEKHLSDFAPNNGVDINAIYADVYAAMTSVSNYTLRSIALHILEDLKDLWLTVPAAVSMHHDYVGGTLIHSASVMNIARSIAQVTPGASVDLVTVGALLHDVGKLSSYKLNGIISEMTDEGKLFDHIHIGASLVRDVAKDLEVINHEYQANALDMLCHIILSHHGTLEHGAVVTPLSIEAHIVHHADVIDAASEAIRVSSNKVNDAKWTDKIYMLNNRPHLTTQYVDKVMYDVE